MPETYNLTGADTFVLYDRVFNNLADGDTVTITYPNNSTEAKTGKNGNTIFAQNMSGMNANVTIRVLRGSSDDQFLAGKKATFEQDYAAGELANGSFVKRLGDGSGNVVNDVYSLKGGAFQRGIDSKENVQGDTDQAVSVYNMIFAACVKGIQ